MSRIAATPRRVALTFGAAALAFAAAAGPATARSATHARAGAPGPSASTPPTSLPGPPPGADAGFPAAPAAGLPAAGGVLGPATRISGKLAGPGLLGSTATLSGHTVTVPIACADDGRARISDPAVKAGTLARGRYQCSTGRATVTFTLATADAARAKALKSSVATITLGTASYSVTIARAAGAPPMWGSDGGLQCDFYGANRALLVAPNFTVTPNVAIDMRPWLAVYTAGSGWQWYGTGGLGVSTWSQWTATPTGVLEWMTPAGALNRWSWSPISVPSGKPVWVVAGFELVYLYAQPRYAWAFTGAQTPGGQTARMCAYGQGS